MDDKRVEAAAWLIGSVLNYECGGDWDKLNDFAKEHYTRVAKAALELSDAAAWQPIETAPRDGREIFLWSPEGEVELGLWDDGWGEYITPEYSDSRICDGEFRYFSSVPKMWHPNRPPAPPSDATP